MDSQFCNRSSFNDSSPTFSPTKFVNLLETDLVLLNSLFLGGCLLLAIPAV